MDSCIESKHVRGLSKLDTEEILNKSSIIFNDYDQLDKFNFESALGAFDIRVSEQSILFNCGSGVPEEDLNKIIDLMLEYGCPFYDPQIEIRFDGK